MQTDTHSVASWRHSQTYAHTLNRSLPMAARYMVPDLWAHAISPRAFGHTLNRIRHMAAPPDLCPHTESAPTCGHTLYRRTRYLSLCIWPHTQSHQAYGHTLNRPRSMVIHTLDCPLLCILLHSSHLTRTSSTPVSPHAQPPTYFSRRLVHAITSKQHIYTRTFSQHDRHTRAAR